MRPAACPKRVDTKDMIGHLLLVIKPFVGTPRTCTVAPIIFVTTLSLLLFTHSAFASPPSDIGIEGKPAISDIINETIHERLGNTAEALSDYDGVLALNPNYAIAHSSRGNQYYSRGMYKEALQDFDRAIDLDPKLAVAYEYRGKTYAKLKEFDKAIKDLDMAIGLEPSRGWAYVYRGIARVELGKLPDAIKDFDKAIALNPKYEGTYAYRMA